ncbi:peptidase M23 [Dissulfurispira thermophila]|uniref:Peptidase M23 n=2 Tax=root TaxID=1 RepID=A0A7G1H3V8_9BACT|nr:M23 family metallopeptidase [Dissulfurispira thermophila]BCB96427.1 peptidase M23 [Dissulfurispira thermophila]
MIPKLQPLEYQSSMLDSERSTNKVMAKQIETVFLNEFLKIMMEQTSFGKDRTVSTYMPYITSEIAKSIAEERGIGVGDFFSKISTAGIQDAKSQNQIHWDGKLNLPVHGRVTSGYGLRYDPIDGRLRHHNGVDIAIPEGSPVKAAQAGRVVFSGKLSGYGNAVIVDHGNGMTSLYAHNSLNLVKPGDVVDKNSILALSGSSGRSTGPHLHFEVRKDGVAVDPMSMIG